MTTTRAFQSQPDFFTSRKNCEAASVKRNHLQTNPRYRNFKQSHFTAGDEEQFQQYRDATNGDVCVPNIDIQDNLYMDHHFSSWEKYMEIGAEAVIGTFRYIFNKFKKGIFVKIKGNRVVVFLPFSKANFINEWSSKIQINPKYGNLDDFLKRFSGKYRYDSRKVNKAVNEWYANNCILRYDIYYDHRTRTKLPNEGDTNVAIIKNMMDTLCAERHVPDIEFFINRRDFPILTRDGTEPYYNIWGGEVPLRSYNLPKYLPILSMCKTDKYADVLVPTHEDWARVQSMKGRWFLHSCRNYNEVFNVSWHDKRRTAVFRGASTGCGVTIETNPRLKLAHISAQLAKTHISDTPLLDAGITKWNLRPRKLQDSRYLQSIDVPALEKQGVHLMGKLTLREQAQYRYIVNVDGHVSAFRLSIELGMGSVILLVDSPWNIWYSKMLVPYKHYVPVARDFSDLVSQIEWCRDNDEKCQQIVAHATTFYNTYIQEKGILDFLQKRIIDLKDEIGVYLYNVETPLDIQLKLERLSIDTSYPTTTKTSANINEIPAVARRTFGLLQGVHWALNLAQNENQLLRVLRREGNIFRNKLGVIDKFILGNRTSKFQIAIKTTHNPQKIREHIHEAFVGTKAINNLLKSIPNFAYTFGLITNKEGTEARVMNEYIDGITLNDYLRDTNKFSMEEFLFILAQICLAINVAQNTCGLVHYDLTPWNIILQRTNTPITVEYIMNHQKVIRVKTKIIPVIIDYGKSHVIVDKKHHGFINMFKVSTIQDILTLLLSAVRTIQTVHAHPRISKNRRDTGWNMNEREFGILITLMDFVTGGKYHRKRFSKNREWDLYNYLKNATKFDVIINTPKYELEQKTPIDMLDTIIRLSKKSKYLLHKHFTITTRYNSTMNKGNSRQIFEYILCETTEQRAQTYFNVFVRLKHCTIPQPSNLFFVYYAVQVLYRNLVSVNEEMRRFLDSTSTFRHGKVSNQGEPMPAQMYQDAYNNCVEYLASVYNPKIEKMEVGQVEYALIGNFSQLELAPYSEESFLDPKGISTIIKDLDKPMVNLASYREIIVSILLHGGTYSLMDTYRKHYLRNFSQLLKIKPLNMMNNVANRVTLNSLALKVYEHDLETLILKLPGEGNCMSARTYVKDYNAILRNFI